MLYQLSSSRAGPASSRKTRPFATIRDKISPRRQNCGTARRQTGLIALCYVPKEGSAMKTLTLMSGAALFAVAGIALAQGGPGPDRRGPDGDVTSQQAIAHVDEMFARLDANHDGRVTPEEMRAMGEHRREEMRQHMFDRIDANHDGNISREEFAEAHAMHRGPGGPDGPGGRGMRMFGDQGFVTLEQMRARALERFDRADANHDGTLTAEERQAAHGRMRH